MGTGREEFQVWFVLEIVITVYVIPDIGLRILNIVLVVFRVVHLSSLSSNRTLCAYDGPLSSKFA